MHEAFADLTPLLSAFDLQNLNVILCSWTTYLPTPLLKTLRTKSLGIDLPDILSPSSSADEFF